MPRRVLALAFALVLASGAGLAGCERFSKKVARPTIASAVQAANVDLELPEAKVFAPEPPVVTSFVLVSRSRVTLLGDPWPIASIPPDPASGLAADDKRDGRSSLTITNLEHAMKWERKIANERAKQHAEGPDPNATMVVIVADATTTYRVLAEVASTASAFGIDGTSFALRTGNPAQPFGIMRRGSRVADRKRNRQPLEVRYGEAGVELATRRETVATGCKDLGKGPAVARGGGAFDFAALETCLKDIKKALPEIVDDGANIRAEAATDFGSLVKVLDALHGAGIEEPELLAPIMPAQTGDP